MTTLKADGVGGQIVVDDQWITISRKGLKAKASHGLSGDKRISLTSVTAVQMKTASSLSNGFIQFSIMGGQESKAGLRAAATDENTVMFQKKHQVAFDAIREHVEATIVRRSSSNPSQSSTAPSSLADELKKLAELRDAGVLSDEEFASQKSKLLG